jgi:hypothetical protein
MIITSSRQPKLCIVDPQVTNKHPPLKSKHLTMAQQAAQLLAANTQLFAYQAASQAHALTSQAQTLFTTTKHHLSSNVVWEKIGPSVAGYKPNIGPALAQLKDSVNSTAAAEYAHKAGVAAVQYAKDHPRVAAVQVLSAATFLVPGLVTVPALGAVVLGGAGPVPGE